MKQPISVTDHAVLRWMERACGLDVAEVRQHIRDEVERGLAVADRLGAAKVTVAVAGVRIVVQDRTVVTVLPKARR